MTAALLAGPLAAVAVDDTDVSPGVLGFVVVALIGLATYLLIRSMNRQIKRIELPDDDASVDGRGDAQRDDPDDASDAPGDQAQR